MALNYPPVAATASLGLGWYGSGSDGAFVLDGATAPAWASRVGSVYTMTRPCYCTNLSASAGVTLKPAGFPIYVSGTYTGNNITIDDSGNNASGATQGNGLAVRGTLNASSTSGGAGRSGGNFNGNAGTSLGGITIGAQGGTGGVATGQTGGAGGGMATPWLGAGGQDSYAGGPRHPGFAWIPKIVSSGTTWSALTVASGGGGGAFKINTGGGSSGAGGSGAGLVVIAARIFDNTGGTIQARGGNGSNAAPTGDASAGGGAGGGGGCICIYTDSYVAAGTQSVAGGTGGTGAGTGGTDGAIGGTGNIYLLNAA